MKVPAQLSGSAQTGGAEFTHRELRTWVWLRSAGERASATISSAARLPTLFLCCGIVACAFNVANVWLLRIAVDPSVYLIDALVLCLAAASLFLYQRGLLPRVVRQRVRLWACFLGCYGAAFTWAALRNRFWPDGISHTQVLLYAVAYGLAFLAVVSPPSGQRWDRHWSFDVLQAAVLAVMFFQTRLYLSYGFSSIAFTPILQAFLGTAAFLANRTATSPEERRLTSAISVYFFLAAALAFFSNFSDALRLGLGAAVGDALYPCDSLAALVLAFSLHTPLQTQRPRPPVVATAMPVLTTAAILLLCIPILRTGSTTGMVLMACAIVLFGVRVSLSLSGYEAAHRTLTHSNEELRKLALTDSLTGIANRRAFMDALRNAVERAETTGPAFALVLMDLDNLKQINDTRGHKAGDVAIRAFAAALQSAMHAPFDHAGRLGGDEFAAILPITTDPAEWTARLRASLRVGGLSFSGGVAIHDLSMKATPEILIERADARLYEEKQRRPQHHLARRGSSPRESQQEVKP